MRTALLSLPVMLALLPQAGLIHPAVAQEAAAQPAPISAPELLRLPPRPGTPASAADLARPGVSGQLLSTAAALAAVGAASPGASPIPLPPRGQSSREPSWARPDQNRVAQAAPPPQAAATLDPAQPAPAAAAGVLVPVPVRLLAGTGRLLGLPAPATTVMAADPRTARVQPSSPTSVFLMAVAPGRTTVIATDDLGRPVAEFDVTVLGGDREAAPPPPAGVININPVAPTAPRRPVNPAQIEAQLRTLLSGPGQVRVRLAGQSIVLSGTVANAADSRRAESIVRGMANADDQIINELSVLSSVQVNLRVRVAEISRDLTRQFGLNWSAISTTGNFAFGLATGGAPFPVGSGLNHGAFLQRALSGATSGGTLSSPQRLGFGYRAGSTDINGVIDALAADNLVTILAEPNLTAQSGEVASFLAGGEFPIPVGASDERVTIEFKQFGVSLAFTPLVLSPDRLTLRVRPEVSELTDQGAVNMVTAFGSITIPALSVRRAETTVELGSGQSFAIAGLLQRNTRQSQEGVNGLTDLPVLGALFRSERFQRSETELVIIVTPYLVRPVSEASALTVPTDGFRPATSLERILYQRQIREGGPAVPTAVPPGLGFRFD